MKNKLLILTCLILLHFTLKAQMKVGDNPTTINTASLLELESGNKGLVFPRVPLTNVASPSPLPSGLLTGTMVYNTNAAIINGNGTGLYLWGGSLWMSVNTGLTSATAWSLTGNAGTNYATNFIGTTDNVGFRVRTNNLQRILVDSLGNVAIGSTAFDPDNRERLLVDYGTTTSHTVANFRGSINDYLQINIHNANSGSKASSDFVATADDGTDSTFYVDMGINSSTYNPSPENWGTQHDAYFYSNSKNLLIGTQADNSDVYFLLGGGQIKLNTALQIKGPSGVIVVGKGESTDTPVGNTIRGPNASPLVPNLAGGDLSLAGGSSTGAAGGGNVIIKGGSSDTGPGGTVYINTTLPTGNVRIGSTANNIIFPKFTTVGGLYYTSLASGQLSTTGANMTWDSIHNRLGIGTTNPLNALSVLGTNPLYLGGVQTTATYAADSILVINAGVVKKAATGSSAWALTGNSNTDASINFLGTTTPQGLVFKVNNVQAGFLGVATSSDVTSFGTGASAGSQQSTAIGAGAQASQLASSALGYKANASAQNSIAIGSIATVNVIGGIAIGSGATTSSQNGIAIGAGAAATSSLNTLAIGTGAQATAQNTTAFGYNASAPAIGGNAFGNSSAASGVNSMAMGNSATASGSNAIVLGDQSTGAGTNPIVLGYNSSTESTTGNTIILGTGSSITGSANSSILIGDGLTTSQSDVLILGNSAKRIGIGTTAPTYKLQVMATADPLYLGGVQTTSTYAADSILVINAGVVKKAATGSTAWSIIGNGGLNATNNFIGTTNAVDFVTRTNGVERMRVLSTGNVGIGTTNPLNALSVFATNPLYLSGVQTTATYAADSLLVINAGVVKKASTGSGGWSVLGNSGTKPNINFIGTTDTAAFVARTNGIEHMRILGTGNPGWISMGAGGIPRSPVDMEGNYQNKNILTIQNTSNTGYTSVDMFDNGGNLSGTFGYANPGVTNTAINGKDYFFIYSNDFLIGTSANNSGVFYIQNGGNIGINTTTPAAKVDVNGNFKLGTNGTTMTAVIDTTNITATTQASQIATNAMGTATVTVTNALINSPVVVSPRTFPGNPFVIAYARVSAANTVTIGIFNTSGAILNASATFKVDLVVINP